MFTNTEKAKIRWYMGSSDRFIDLFTALEHAMTRVTPEAETLVRAAITKLDDINDVKLPDTYNRLKARKVGSINLATEVEISMLRSEARRIVSQMAATLGVAVGVDVFSGMVSPDNRKLF